MVIRTAGKKVKATNEIPSFGEGAEKLEKRLG